MSFSVMTQEETLLGCKDTKAKTYSNNITTLDKTMYSIVLKDIDKDLDADIDLLLIDALGFFHKKPQPRYSLYQV